MCAACSFLLRKILNIHLMCIVKILNIIYNYDIKDQKEDIMKWSITSSTLKWVAIITMIIDHTGAVLFDDYANHPEYLLFRIIGRIAFPIFAFLIVEGYRHTKSVPKYAMRLFAFALISEIPFDLAFYNTTTNWNHQNIFFTLFIGLVALWAFDSLKSKNTILAVLAVYSLGILSQVIKTDYDIFGVILIFGLYSATTKKVSFFWIAIVNIAMAIIYTVGGGNYYQAFALLSIPFVAMYNGEKGSNSRILQYTFYIIYPAHIMILYLIDKLVSLKS